VSGAQLMLGGLTGDYSLHAIHGTLLSFAPGGQRSENCADRPRVIASHNWVAELEH
jgi:hypothetical protein